MRLRANNEIRSRKHSINSSSPRSDSDLSRQGTTYVFLHCIKIGGLHHKVGSIISDASVQAASETFGKAIFIREQACTDDNFSDKNCNQQSRVLYISIGNSYDNHRKKKEFTFVMMLRVFMMMMVVFGGVGNEQRK